MKKFLAKASKPFSQLPSVNMPTMNLGLPSKSNSNEAGPSGSNAGGRFSNSTSSHILGLQPKDILPPVPHPHPYHHLALLATEKGLVLRSHVPNDSSEDQSKVSYIRISWGKAVTVEELDESSGELDWSESVIVYGIVGMLELFNGSYLLVITSRVEVGNVLDPLNNVYAIKNVVDIPLVEDRAQIALNTLAARNHPQPRPSLIAPLRRREPSATDIALDDVPDAARKGSTRVQFVMPDIKEEQTNDSIGKTIPRPSSAQSSSSDNSVASSDASAATSPVFKTVASRLSFWSRLSKRTNPTTTPTEDSFLIPEPMSLVEEQEVLDKLMQENQENHEERSEVIETILTSTAPPPITVEEKHSELETKIVRECIREFSKGGMYFAYNFDITRSLQHKHELVLRSQKHHQLLAGLGALPSPENQQQPPSPSDMGSCSLAEPNPTLPLWRRVDKQFWWNEWISKPFIDAGLHSFILPIMQGYCQVATFTIPPDDLTVEEDASVDYVIFSRRSRHRPGLRYQRRGVDDEAHVANFVETETIVHVEREEKKNVFSYVQIRGSIPLFWTQNGYGLKPPPVLATDRTPEQNLEAIKRHFSRTIPVYGPHTIVNLAEQQGREGVITDSYRHYMQELNNKDAQYCEYDFHTETKGMKYENISQLIEKMERVFEAQGYFWVSDNVVFSKQKGVFRVNCIDCLDRTNVVQSAFARYVMNKQLGAVALLNPSNSGRTDADLVFNDVWANNGDAISRAYAGTSALKGDFTRTGKRDLSGMLNDGVNSLARMYTSTFSDWFCQAVIDFMLGNRTLSVFSEFLHKLSSTDPRDLIRLSKIRSEAIATCVSRVLPEGERVLSAWTLLTPADLNQRVGMKFEEKVLLLSARALYIVSYDYTLGKVKLYTRVPLGDIIGISKGAYILSPLEESSRDAEQNAGFVVTWLSSRQESRVTSYSVRNSLDLSGLDGAGGVPSSPRSPRHLSTPLSARNGRGRSNTFPTLTNILSGASFSTAGSGEKNFTAFKVLPLDPARMRREGTGGSVNSISGGVGFGLGVGGVSYETSEEMRSAKTCKDAVDLIVDRIVKACEDVGGAQGVDFVKEEDVVSVAEAQHMTSVFAKMEYGFKRLLWLGG